MADIKWGNFEIRKWNYMCHKYSNSNYGSHTQALMLGNLTLFFSYDTVVAFQSVNGNFYSENQWGPTTGKHLNYICPDKKKRLKREVFEKFLQKALDDFKWFSVTEL